MRTAGFRVTVSALVGIVAGGAAALVAPWQVSQLAGWDVAAVIFLVWVWGSVVRLDALETRAIARPDDLSPLAADVVLLGASVGCLVATGFVLVKANEGSNELALEALAVVSVVLSWAVVHTVFALHYADSFYTGDEGGIEFADGPPDFRDFAYLAFTVGMTYQVSDTALTTREMRRLALRHALLSFVFGTFILAVTINGIAGLLTS